MQTFFDAKPIAQEKMIAALTTSANHDPTARQAHRQLSDEVVAYTKWVRYRSHLKNPPSHCTNDAAHGASTHY
jgi:hypothetical protein